MSVFINYQQEREISKEIHDPVEAIPGVSQKDLCKSGFKFLHTSTISTSILWWFYVRNLYWSN